MIKDVTLRDTHIDWIPQIPTSWEILRSKYVFQNKSLKNNPNEPLLSVSQRDGVVVRSESDMNVWNPTDDVSGYKLIEPGDFVISLRSFEGGLELSKVKGIVSPAYTVLETIRKIDDHYFWWLMKSHQFIIELNKHVTGIRQGKNIGWDDFSNIYLTLPPLEEQKLISRYLDKKTNQIDSLINKIEKKIELLKEQRISLINRCVTKGLNPNVEMKDSGVDWVGEIPRHWVVKKLPWVCYFQEGPGLRNWQFTDTGVPVVCVTNITPDGLSFEKYQRYISEDEYNLSYKHFTVEDGDLLMASSGNSFGKICSYDGEFDFKFILNTSTIRLHSLDNNEILTPYIKLIVQSEIFQNQIRILITGAAQPNFGPTHLNQIRIPIPSIDEQLSILSRTKNKISNVEKMIDKELCRIKLFSEYRNSLISSTVSGKVRVTEEMI